MRFIGSKNLLLENIEQVIKENTEGNEKIFCDMFSGTGVVARYFKPKYEIISNDLLYFSYVLQRATIENNKVPMFEGLAKIGIPDPFKYLEDKEDITGRDEEYFITGNYAPGENCNRMYLTGKNARRIDFIRITIEEWKSQKHISEGEYFYLLACLVEGVPFVSNITGTYGAYLKSWDKRTYKDFELARLSVVDNSFSNKVFNKDANCLITEIEGDILYLDPPYNSRQYAPNYHLLETISRYDAPKIRGITGMRPYEAEKSAFCVKSEVLAAFEELVSKAKFSHIVVSYSTDGLMSAEEIEKILKNHGIKHTFKRYDIPYRKYKSKSSQKKETLSEYIFYIRKAYKSPEAFARTGGKEAKKTVTANKYIKSPLNYIGGKYKLLPQIMPLFPKKIETFADIFSGGANVAINVSAKNIVCNDINTKIIELFQAFQETPIDLIMKQIEENIENYGLSKENEKGFLKFRNYYNETKNPIDLYTLTCFSFNYQFRFNRAMEYNNPFGRNRSQFSQRMRNSLVAFVDRLSKTSITFQSGDFFEFYFDNMTPKDMIYCDPPYLITTGSYNDGKRGFKGWSEVEEKQLLEFLDNVNAKGIPFALSNVIEHKGNINQTLLRWSKKYKVIDLNFGYSNACYNTARGESREVLIVNY